MLNITELSDGLPKIVEFIWCMLRRWKCYVGYEDKQKQTRSKMRSSMLHCGSTHWGQDARSTSEMVWTCAEENLSSTKVRHCELLNLPSWKHKRGHPKKCMCEINKNNLRTLNLPKDVALDCNGWRHHIVVDTWSWLTKTCFLGQGTFNNILPTFRGRLHTSTLPKPWWCEILLCEENNIIQKDQYHELPLKSYFLIIRWDIIH